MKESKRKGARGREISQRGSIKESEREKRIERTTERVRKREIQRQTERQRKSKRGEYKETAKRVRVNEGA
jgi:hypothetical protein